MSDDTPQWALEMSKDIGMVLANTESLKGTFIQHVADDKLLGERIIALELAHARQRGAAKIIAMLLNAVIGILGAIGGLFLGGHHR